MSDDRSYLFGDGLFETVRVEQGGPVALDRHIARFVRSANALAYPQASIQAGLVALHSLNSAEPGIHRVTVSRDDPDAPFGGTGGVSVRMRPFPDGARPRLKMLRSWYFPEDELAAHKSTSYLRHVEARRRALRMGADDVLLVSPDGLIGEASTSNVFVEFRTGLATPPLRGILPGVTRQRIIDTMDVFVRPIHVDELATATAIVLTNAAVIAVAALEFEGRSLSGHAAIDIIEALDPGP